MPPSPARRLFRFPRRTAAQVTADVEAELDFHLDMVARELVEEGWHPEEARAEARRRFGDLQGTIEYCRALDVRKETQMKWKERLGGLGQDLRYGIRQLGKSPGFTLVAVLTLALGIGATTAIFSVVYGAVIRPLPWKEPERLVRLFFLSPEGERHGAFSPANFLDLRAQSKTLSGVTAITNATLNLSGGGAEPERLPGARVSANYFEVMGMRPMAGRTFAPDEDQPGAQRVAVISEELWRRRFGGDPEMIGRILTLNGEPHTVVGILARGTQLPSGADAWVPLAFTPDEVERRGAVWFGAFGRLAPGATLERATAEGSLIARRLAKQYPDANAGYLETMTFEPLQESLIGPSRKPLLLLLGAVSFVLLIACVNVANLLLVRAASRQGEIVIRSALGAGRSRIVRQLLTESVVLALAGGAAGVALAFWATRALVKLAPAGVPRLEELGIDSTALLFALGVSLLTGVLFGLAPALQTSRTDLSAALREGTRGSKGKGGTRARSLLVVAEMALAVVLLAGAGLLIRSFALLQGVKTGFDQQGVVTFNLELPTAKYSEEEKLRSFTAALTERLARLPGVESAGATVSGLPFDGGEDVLTFSVEGRPPAPPGKEDSMIIGTATPDYFKTLGIPVVRGRAFLPQDRAGAPGAMVINEAAARRFFPHQNPLGQRVTIGARDAKSSEIVGVVADFKQDELEREVEPQMFLPYDQLPWESLAVVLRSSQEAQALAPAIRTAVRELDPDLPLYGLQSMDELVAKSTAPSRFYMLLLGGFAFISLVLAAVGIYGVIAYAVRQRTQEIGIRIALGATGDRVLRMVVGQGLALAGVGALLGLLGALYATRGMQSLLFEVSASDPTIYVGVALVLVAVAAVASYLPARRAARTDPQLVLRGEV
ncbi:MAG TPA: ABC transporter permease [Thermoanaerobaculia bacterium]